MAHLHLTEKDLSKKLRKSIDRVRAILERRKMLTPKDIAKLAITLGLPSEQLSSDYEINSEPATSETKRTC